MQVKTPWARDLLEKARDKGEFTVIIQVWPLKGFSSFINENLTVNKIVTYLIEKIANVVEVEADYNIHSFLTCCFCKF